jgi:hypothetical protein
LYVHTHLYEYQSNYTRQDIASNIECYGKFIKEAIDYVAALIPPALSIDRNNDGYVDNISIILQGIAEGWGDKL